MLQSLLLAVMLAVSPSDPAAVRVTRLDGRTAEGRLVGWTASEVAIGADGGELRVDPEELLSLQRLAAIPAPQQSDVRVRLIDGSEIGIVRFLKPMTTGRPLEISATFPSEPLRLPTKIVRAIEFVPRADAADPAWQELDRADRADDLLVVRKKEGDSLDTIAGVVRGFDDEKVDFEWDGESVAVKRSKAAAIGFHRVASPPRRSPICELALVDGSRLKIQFASMTGAAVSLTLVSGVQVQLPLEGIASADFSTGKLVFLSDLEPVGKRWVPYVADPPDADLVGSQGEPREDRSFAGEPLSLRLDERSGAATAEGLKQFLKGLALRSGTQVAYRIPEGMTRFRATAGIDPATVREGDVLLEIRGNDRVLWQGEISGRRPPVEIDVALGDARRLELRVDYGTNRDFGDRLHLVEARVTK